MKDHRYKAIKNLIQNNGVQGLKEIFTILPLSVVKEDMKVNYSTIRRRIEKGDLITIKDILAMALLFDVEPAEVFRLIINDIKVKTTNSSKKNK